MKSFDQFRAELADAVTCAINDGSGWVIGTGNCHRDKTCCPLGTKTRCADGAVSAFTHPWPADAARAWGIPIFAAESFMSGFDGLPLRVSDRRFFDLGRAYRERFVGAAR